jgi:hypothetical protein
MSTLLQGRTLAESLERRLVRSLKRMPPGSVTPERDRITGALFSGE